MGSMRSQINELVEHLCRLGCEADRAPGGHWRITYEGVYLGAIASTPHSGMGLAHSKRKITNRLNRLKATGRTW